MTTDAIYQELILQHYRRSRHRGILETPDATASVANPICGDELSLSVALDGDTIREIRFTGHGCSVSQAAASMTAQLLEGRTVAEGRRLADEFSKVVAGSAQATPELGDLRALAGVARFPSRVRCALLPWDAFRMIDRQLGGDDR